MSLWPKSRYSDRSRILIVCLRSTTYEGFSRLSIHDWGFREGLDRHARFVNPHQWLAIEEAHDEVACGEFEDENCAFPCQSDRLMHGLFGLKSLIALPYVHHRANVYS